jgi:glutamate N-acetyltransferase/amino-acid N-acetyltransferase
MSEPIDTSPGAVTRVPGFRAAAVACGLKASGQPDLALVACDRPAAAAAMLTGNAFKAAPVLYDAAVLSRSHNTIQAVVINAGNANACTGEQGHRDAERMAALAEEALGLPAGSALVMSTGIIGHPMPMDKIEAGIRAVAAALDYSADGGAAAARAIMTTDLVPKEAFAQVQVGGVTVSIGGMIKGSGMIHPNLARADQLHATMLGLVVTDAAVPAGVLAGMLERATAASFNRITIDGDTSTNDTILLLASGRAGNPPIGTVGAPLEGAPGRAGTSPAPTGTPGDADVGAPLVGAPGRAGTSPAPTGAPGDYAAFEAALTGVCVSLARQIARDGEGATRLVEIVVLGAEGEAEAERAAKTVATSPLVKTAIFGADPNWGRVLAAIGRSGIRVEPARVSLWLGRVQLVAGGEPLAFDVEAARAALRLPEVRFVADLGLGAGQATVWTCDLSYRYVEINAEYHT